MKIVDQPPDADADVPEGDSFAGRGSIGISQGGGWDNIRDGQRSGSAFQHVTPIDLNVFHGFIPFQGGRRVGWAIRGKFISNSLHCTQRQASHYLKKRNRHLILRKLWGYALEAALHKIKRRRKKETISLLQPRRGVRLPARGNALGKRKNESVVSAQRANGLPQGTIGPLGRHKCCRHSFPRAVPWAWRTVGPSAQQT